VLEFDHFGADAAVRMRNWHEQAKLKVLQPADEVIVPFDITGRIAHQGYAGDFAAADRSEGPRQD
jgi:hypothetical protein